jgi:HK97 family phage major capsid protein
MTIKFKDDIEANVEKFRAAYYNAVKEGAEPEEVEAKHGEYMMAYGEALTENVMERARKEAQNGTDDTNIAIARGRNVLTNEERKFFNELVNPNTDTHKEPKILTETTIERVFDDIKQERPLLSRIRFNLAGLNTRLILADPSGQAVWGEIFGKIQGQIDSNFKVVNFSQNKLTAFALVPKDLIKFGPEWVERFVREQIAEAIGIQLEIGIVSGGGSTLNQPIGMTKDMVKDEDGNITSITDKTSTGTLTFADAKTTAKELAQVMTHLSTKENGKGVDVSGGVTLVVNPQDQFLVQAQHTMQTQNGAWVTSLPFNISVVASEGVSANKVVALVDRRYEAVHTGNVEFRRYDQTMALEDMDVFISKHFAHGMPADNKASAVYDLAIEPLSEPAV